MKIKIDGLDAPFKRGELNITESIGFDEQLRFWYEAVEADITILGIGYEKIKEAMLAGKHCSKLNISIECSQSLFNGYVRVLDAYIDRINCAADVKIKANTPYTVISEHARTKINLFSRYRTNTSCCDAEQLRAPRAFEIESDSCSETKPIGYKATELLRYWLRWVDNIEFENHSPFVEKLLVSRVSLLIGETEKLEFSFEDIIQNIYAQIPIELEVKDGVVHLYDAGSSTEVNISGIKNIGINTYKEKVYSTIKVGAEYTNPEDVEEDNCNNWKELRHKITSEQLYNWREVNVANPSCGNDQTFDLTNSYIIDSNSIQNAIENLSEKDKRKNVLLYGSFGNKFTPDVDSFFNENLMNVNKLKRHSKELLDSGVRWQSLLPIANGSIIMEYAIFEGNALGLNDFSLIGLDGFDDFSDPPQFYSSNVEFQSWGQRKRTVFTPEKSGCYCLRYTGTINIWFEWTKLNWKIIKDNPDGEVVHEELIDLNELDPVKTDADLGRKYDIDRSICVELEKGQPYLIDGFYDPEGFSDVTYNQNKIYRGAQISVQECADGSGAKTALDYTIEGHMCKDKWNEIKQNKRATLIAENKCGDYSGRIIKLNRTLNGSLTGNVYSANSSQRLFIIQLKENGEYTGEHTNYGKAPFVGRVKVDDNIDVIRLEINNVPFEQQEVTIGTDNTVEYRFSETRKYPITLVYNDGGVTKVYTEQFDVLYYASRRFIIEERINGEYTNEHTTDVSAPFFGRVRGNGIDVDHIEIDGQSYSQDEVTISDSSGADHVFTQSGTFWVNIYYWSNSTTISVYSEQLTVTV